MIVRLYSLFFLLFVYTASQAQLEEVYPPENYFSEIPAKKVKSSQTDDKSTPCGIDTLYYSRYNNTMASYRLLNLGGTRGGGMYFAIDDTVWLQGFNFYALAWLSNINILTTQNVTCKVYYASTSKLPAGVALASGTATINATGYNLNQMLHTFLFSQPVMLVSDFVITIEFSASLSNRVILPSNDYLANDGLGKQFSCVRLGGNWSNNLVISDTIPFDADFFMEPIVEYNMSAQFDHGPNSCLGNGQPFEFVNTTTFALNPQFSKEAIDSTLDDNFIWDYGDGSKTDTMVNGSHTYLNTFGFWVNLDATFTNWRGNVCKDDSSIFIEEGDVQADFQLNQNGLLINFTDKSVNANKWEWNFGDGSSKSIQQNPSHLYTSNGIYFITQKARDRGCVDSLTLKLDLSYVGLEDQESLNQIEIGPNPANEFLNVKSDNVTGIDYWKIFNIHGKLMNSGLVSSEFRIPLLDYGSGVYFIKFEFGDQILTKRFIVQ